MMSAALRIAAKLAAIACLVQGLTADCEIPAEYHGDYYSSDMEDFELVHISSSGISSTLKKASGREQQLPWQLKCSDINILQSEHVRGRGYRNVTSMLLSDDTQTVCVSLQNPSFEYNVLRLKDTRPSKSACPPLFAERQTFSYRQEGTGSESECFSEDNAFHPLNDITGMLIQWGTCNTTESYISIGSTQNTNVTVDCLGTWVDHNRSTWGISNTDEGSPLLHKFQCFWFDGTTIKLSMSTEDCARHPDQREVFASFTLTNGVDWRQMTAPYLLLFVLSAYHLIS